MQNDRRLHFDGTALRHYAGLLVMFDCRLKTVGLLISVCVLLTYSIAVAQPLSKEGGERVDIVATSSNKTAKIDETIAWDARKLDLSEAYKIRKPDSFRGIEPIAPPSESFFRAPPPVVNSKKVMELLRNQKEWVFLEPTEADFGLTAKDIFNLEEHDPNKKEDEEQSPLARFYQRLRNDNKGRTNGVSESKEASEDGNPLRLENLWSVTQDYENTRFLKPFTAGAVTIYESYTVLNTGGNGYRDEKPDIKADEERIRIKESRADQFKRLLDSNFAIPTGDDPAVGGGSWYHSSDPWNFPSTRPGAIGGVTDPAAAPAKEAFSTLPSAAGLHSLEPGVQNISLPAGYTSLSPALPVPTERRPEMPQPVFEMPKRRF